jgi:hypothetical protein
MIVKRKFLWFAVGILAAALAASAVVSNRFGSRFLRASVVETKADFGIPRISKMYAAKLTNFGIGPVKVASCDYLDDAFSHGTMVAYAVQRWDETSQQWRTVVASNTASFCKPYPLGIVRGKVANRWLWPGRSLSSGEEATAARDGFRRGDKARFVVFVSSPGDYSNAVATGAFKIDEEPSRPDLNLRLRH